jgi:tetratricopeptide (TPR) repeat protein
MTLGAYYAENGEAEHLESLLGEIRAAAGGTGEEGETARSPLLTLAADAIDAYGSARNGNPAEREEAIFNLGDLAWTALPPSVWVRWWLGDLNMEDGRPGAAVPYLEALRGTGVPHVANLQLGRAYTQLGERAKARDAYVRFLQAWEEADPDLPQLDEARAALEELLAG